ncbi:MAG: hypothetical protein ACRDKT_04475 [Actinomycetota bacterium]
MKTKRIIAIASLVLGLSALAAPATAAPNSDPFPKTLWMDGNGNACGGLFGAGGQGAVIYAAECTPQS